MRDKNHTRLLLLALPVAGALLLASWLALPGLQEKRADAMLNDANGHISEANRLMAGADLASLDPASFSSEAAIAGARPQLEKARGDLERAAAEIESARADTGAAARLYRLPAEYRTRLEKKEELASLRKRQADVLIDATARLQELYASGEAVFDAVREADRLKGQLLSALDQVQGQPQQAGETLAGVEESALRLSGQLDEERDRASLSLLVSLSTVVKQYQELAALGRELAAAAAGGDQAAAQRLAAELERQRSLLSSGSAQLGAWWEANISLLMDEFEALQEEMEGLDAEVAEMR